jgi:hypothetical protein
MNLLAIFGIFSTVVVSIWAVLKYIVLGSYKFDNDTSKRFIEAIESESTFNWILASECVTDPRYPDVYGALVVFHGVWFFFNRNERLLTAGWKGKEENTFITFPRWQRKKIQDLIKRKGFNNTSIPVMAMFPSGADRLGELTANPQSKAIVDNCADIEVEVQEVLDGKKSKTGMLLYGLPGNGKTQFIKHLARKHSLPIHVVYLNPEYGNYEVASMFASIPRRCIVLMEDFDNYFDGRKCVMNDQVKFTFDAFINALDGVHNDYKQVIFAMTANDISKIDSSLTARPSRFKFVKQFGPPSEVVRRTILNDEALVKETEGLSLDEVFNYQKESSPRPRRTRPRRSSGMATSKNNSQKQIEKRKIPSIRG